jgi:hypothetical protein
MDGLLITLDMLKMLEELLVDTRRLSIRSYAVNNKYLVAKTIK